LSLRLPSVVIVHEIANVKYCGSQVWNRNRKLVNAYEAGSWVRAFIIPYRIRVAVGHESVLTRILSIVTRCIETDDPVNDQIVRVARIGSKHDDVSHNDRTSVLTPYHDKSPNRQYAVVGRTHTFRRDDENRIFRIERQTDSAPNANRPQDHESYQK